MKSYTLAKMGMTVGLVSMAFFVICMGWGVLFTDPVLKELHLNLLRLTLPGFSFTVGGMFVGLMEAFVYGWVLGGLFAWLGKKSGPDGCC